jgi:acyl carrier protein
MLLGVLSGLVADVLRLRRDEVAPRERLFDLGVDSLIALELKNRLQAVLGMPLSTTLLFDYPTIEALTDYLLGMLVPALAERQHAGAGAPVRITDEVEDLSEEEAESMLLAQLEQLEGRLS